MCSGMDVVFSKARTNFRMFLNWLAKLNITCLKQPQPVAVWSGSCELCCIAREIRVSVCVRVCVSACVRAHVYPKWREDLGSSGKLTVHAHSCCGDTTTSSPQQRRRARRAQAHPPTYTLFSEFLMDRELRQDGATPAPEVCGFSHTHTRS